MEYSTDVHWRQQDDQEELAAMEAALILRRQQVADRLHAEATNSGVLMQPSLPVPQLQTSQAAPTAQQHPPRQPLRSAARRSEEDRRAMRVRLVHELLATPQADATKLTYTGPPANFMQPGIVWLTEQSHDHCGDPCTICAAAMLYAVLSLSSTQGSASSDSS
jgi:hypothetical protein